MFHRLYVWMQEQIFVGPPLTWEGNREAYTRLGISLAFVIILLIFLFGGGIQGWVLLGYASGQLNWLDKIIFVMLLGAVAYWAAVLKTANQHMYGLLEIAFGLFATYHVIGREMTDSRVDNLFPVIASVYLLSEGLTNIRETKAQKTSTN